MLASDIGALALRLMVAGEFVPSGISDLRDPPGRAKQNGVSPAFITVIGVAEVAGGLGLVAGVLARAAAIGLILIMAGAIQKKAVVWKTGYWGASSPGWHYELMLVTMCLAIALAGPGRVALAPGGL